MRVALAGLVGCLLGVHSGCVSAPPPPRPTAILPLKTLRLYETGVGYFERAGNVQATGDMALPIPSAHLDDALKTLVVLGAKGTVRVDGVQFGSSVSRAMARAMAGLPQDADSPIEYRDLLVSLKGAGVEVTLPKQRLRGRLIDVLGKEPAVTLVLLLDSTDLVRIEAAQIVTIRATDPSYANRLGAGLDALSTRGAQSQRLMRVLASSSGPVTLGYIAETPIWRTTYRLVLDDKPGGATMLQGWALLHNDTDEAWQQVSIELVNGRPDSFLFPLAAPRYARRELAHPETNLSTVPQLVDQTADILWGDHLDDAHGVGGLGLIGTGAGGGGSGSGYGIGLGRIGTVGHGSGSGTSSLISVDSIAEAPEAKGVEAGALFSYRLAEPLQLRAHASALVPFVQRPIVAEPIVWFGTLDAEARSAVRVVNTTQQTLPTGTLALFSGGGFAGEAALERMKPNEKRFIEYGTDLDVELSHRRLASAQSVKRLTFAGQQLTEHYLQTTEEEYELENRSGQARTVWIKLPFVARAQVTGPDKQELDASRGGLVASFVSPARDKRIQKVVAVEPLTRARAIGDLDTKWIETALTHPSLEAPDRAVLQEAAPRQRALEQTRVQLAIATKELAGIDADLGRLREHVKAITAEKASAAPVVTRILAAEDRRTATLKRIDALETEQETRQLSVRDALARLARTP